MFLNMWKAAKSVKQLKLNNVHLRFDKDIFLNKLSVTTVIYRIVYNAYCFKIIL